MATLFTKIIRGEIPGRFVHRDEHSVAFMTKAPIRPGHTLVVPIREVDHWIDLGPELTAHLFTVAQRISRGIQKGFGCRKVGLSIIGLEVPHCHLHLLPLDHPDDMDFKRQQQGLAAETLDAHAETLRAALRSLE